jgi:hypothetical protein
MSGARGAGFTAKLVLAVCGVAVLGGIVSRLQHHAVGQVLLGGVFTVVIVWVGVVAR